MFSREVGLAIDHRRHGRKVAIEFFADIHEYTDLRGTDTQKDEPYLNARQLFDFNEHFIELGSSEGPRSLLFMAFALLAFGVAFCFAFLLLTAFDTYGPDEGPKWVFVSLGLALFLFAASAFGAHWYYGFRSVFLTALTARYRFNRTTGKVYVLRPKSFGGNAVLDWHRVRAHVNWRAPTKLKPGFQHDPDLRSQRTSGSGYNMHKGLVLYWPPFDPEDPERKGEDILWVGADPSNASLWEYIRLFMQEGMDAVPAPEAHQSRRKGRSPMCQHLWEQQFDMAMREARLLDNPDPRSAVTIDLWLQEAPFIPFNSMAQWLCYWPTFPEEWNSDCGQRRREDGLGPEEPLRWAAK